MATFRPPTDNFVAFVLPEDPSGNFPLSLDERFANQIGYHIRNAARGRNIYKLVDGTYTDGQPSDPDLIAKVYYGGHDIEVDEQEVADLTAAGYGAYIT